MFYLIYMAKMRGISMKVIAGCPGLPAESFNLCNSRLLYKYGLAGG